MAVVGAGPAGLAAAWTLCIAGAEVTVYEAASRPGGKLRTEDLGNARVDVAVQFLASHYHETLRIVREIGADSLLVRASGRDALWRRRRAHSLTYGSVTSMAASTALPAGLKLRLLARYLPFLTRHSADLDPNLPARAARAGLDERSIASWGREVLGEDFVELLAYPLLAAYHGAAPEETSAGFYHALAGAGLQVSLRSVRGGMGALADHWRGALEAQGAVVRPGEEVEGITASPGTPGHGGDGVRILVAGSEEFYDAAVAAVPPPRARALLTGCPEELSAWLAQVRSRPTGSLSLHVAEPQGEGWFGLAFPRRTSPGRTIAALCALDRKTPGAATAGTGLLLACPSPGCSEAFFTKDSDAVLALVLEALEEPFPDLRPRVLSAKLHRIPDGHVLFHPGYLRHLARYDPGWLPASVALAGDYLVAPSVEGAVRSGIQAARRVLAGRAPEGSGSAPRGTG